MTRDVPRVHEPRRRRLRDRGCAQERRRDRRRDRRRSRLRRQHEGGAHHAGSRRARAAWAWRSVGSHSRSPGSPGWAISSPPARATRVGIAAWASSSGAGRKLDDIVAETNMVAEGVKSTGAVLELAAQHGVDMPIATLVGSGALRRCDAGRPRAGADAARSQGRARRHPVTRATTTRVGVLGRPRGAPRRPDRGASVPDDSGWTLDWRIGADDRWRMPERETAVRQTLVDRRTGRSHGDARPRR